MEMFHLNIQELDDMAVPTLLEMTKSVATFVGADEVSSIPETVESIDIANILLVVLKDFTSRYDWEFLNDQTGQLETTAYPFIGKIPASYRSVTSVYKDSSTDPNRKLMYLMPKYFIKLCSTRAGDQFEGTAGLKLKIPKGLPRYYTSFDEKNIVVDGYDDGSATLGNTIIIGRKHFDMTGAVTANIPNDNWVAPIPEVMVAFWLAEASALAHFTMRQAPSERKEMEAARLWQALVTQEPLTRREETVMRLSRREAYKMAASAQVSQQQGGNQ